MMRADIVVPPLVWLAVWIIGCVVFDAVLEFRGAWLMLAGVITYHGGRGCAGLVADWLYERRMRTPTAPPAP